MGMQEIKTPKHWNYFLALEDDVARLSRYVELAEDNFDCYSLELARILSSAASEVDVVAKQLCRKLNPDSKADSINAYRKEILPAYPWLNNAEVLAPRFGLTFCPWGHWGEDKNPLWWKAYNNVKHERHTHYAEASLKHTLNAVTGLFLAILIFYREEGASGQLAPNASIFRAGPPLAVDQMFYAPHTMVFQMPAPEQVKVN
jgi:hypothetical protein